jgi:hypothetical protein
MRPRYLFVLLFIVFSFIASAQSLIFCEDVDNNGRPVSASSTFTIPRGGGYFKFFLTNDGEEFDTDIIHYEIYRVRGSKKTYETTIDQEIEPEWTYCWKKVTFYKAGLYEVVATTEEGETIASSTLKIEFAED